MNPRERKQSLRDAILAARDALDPASRTEASAAIAARIGATDALVPTAPHDVGVDVIVTERRTLHCHDEG